MNLEGAEEARDAWLLHYFGATLAARPPGARKLPDGIRQSDIVMELIPEQGDIVIQKPRFSGFYDTNLDERLRAMGVSTIVFTGCTTSICVESTLRDASFRNYACLLLEDCCAEPIGHQFVRSNHDASAYLVETMLGSVARSEDFIASVRARK